MDQTTVYGLVLVTKVNLSRGSVNLLLCSLFTARGGWIMRVKVYNRLHPQSYILPVPPSLIIDYRSSITDNLQGWTARRRLHALLGSFLGIDFAS